MCSTPAACSANSARGPGVTANLQHIATTPICLLPPRRRRPRCPSCPPPKGRAPRSHGPHVDYELVLDCVHCGLCTASCPTYVETSNEADSPRGRIYLMRGVIDGTLELDDDVKQHLDLCLNCRACETACPSGVQYGRILEPFREFMDGLEPGRQVQSLNALQKFLLFHVFPYRWRNRVSLAPARAHAVDRPRLARGEERPDGPAAAVAPQHEADAPRAEAALRSVARSAGTGRPARGRASRCSWAASPIPFTPKRTTPPRRCSRRTAARCGSRGSQGCCGALHYHSGAGRPGPRLRGGQLRGVRGDRRGGVQVGGRDHHQRGRVRLPAQGLRAT